MKIENLSLSTLSQIRGGFVPEFTDFLKKLKDKMFRRDI